MDAASFDPVKHATETNMRGNNNTGSGFGFGAKNQLRQLHHSCRYQQQESSPWEENSTKSSISAATSTSTMNAPFLALLVSSSMWAVFEVTEPWMKISSKEPGTCMQKWCEVTACMPMTWKKRNWRDAIVYKKNVLKHQWRTCILQSVTDKDNLILLSRSHAAQIFGEATITPEVDSKPSS